MPPCRGCGPVSRTNQSCCWDLNPGPRPYQGRALPAELQQRRVFVSCSRGAARTRNVNSSDRAGDGNRTHISCLEGRGFTTKLHPQLHSHWAGRDSNPRTPKRPDLQSGAIDRSATCPSPAREVLRREDLVYKRPTECREARGGNRTRNLRFTKPLLCQLSYTSKLWGEP